MLAHGAKYQKRASFTNNTYLSIISYYLCATLPPSLQSLTNLTGLSRNVNFVIFPFFPKCRLLAKPSKCARLGMWSAIVFCWHLGTGYKVEWDCLWKYVFDREDSIVVDTITAGGRVGSGAKLLRCTQIRGKTKQNCKDLNDLWNIQINSRVQTVSKLIMLTELRFNSSLESRIPSRQGN